MNIRMQMRTKTMKRFCAFASAILSLLSFALLLTGCFAVDDRNENPDAMYETVVLDDNNYWKYLNISSDTEKTSDGERFVCCVNGVIDFALYEDVVLSFDVIYYVDGATEADYNSYTMRIACNAAGGAEFETTSYGHTNVAVGKWLGADGALVSLQNYNWKVHLHSVTGTVRFVK